MNILLVEDDVILCNLLTKIFKFENITSIVTHDGCEAEDVLITREPNIDLILCDVMMPNMDGYEFLKHVKNIPRYENTPFIFTTARVSRDEELRGLTLGARAYLKKPIDITTLLDIIYQYQ